MDETRIARLLLDAADLSHRGVIRVARVHGPSGHSYWQVTVRHPGRYGSATYRGRSLVEALDRAVSALRTGAESPSPTPRKED